MTAATQTLADWLLACVAEDEAKAREAVIPAHDMPNAHRPHPELSRWRWNHRDGEVEFDYDYPGPYPEPYRVTQDGEGAGSVLADGYGQHIALWDPARVLAECEAKRRIVEAVTHVSHHRREQVEPGRYNVIPVREPYGGDYDMGADVLRLLALPYAGREGYREEWRP